jgi:predicted GIY-YIG superfamily endonuclease
MTRVRVEQHKRKHFDGSPPAMRLISWYGSSQPSRDQAFLRERQIKEWKRLWKIQLIEAPKIPIGSISTANLTGGSLRTKLRTTFERSRGHARIPLIHIPAKAGAQSDSMAIRLAPETPSCAESRLSPG